MSEAALEALAETGLLRDARVLFAELLAIAPVAVGALAIGPELDALAEHLIDEERPQRASRAPKRERELIGGRLLARHVLSQMGEAPVSIPPREDRTPIWPDGLVGSITHSDHLVAVAIAHRAEVAEIGIDVEPDGPVRPELWRKITRPDELEEVPQGEAGGRRVRLLFSAKEAFYKAQYLTTGEVLWHQQVRITIAASGKAFSASVPERKRATEPGQGVIGNGLGHLTTAWLRLAAKSG